jgi:hypothetical protein
MTPKQFFDFGEAGLRSLGFFKKGWIAVGEDGSVTITNTGQFLSLVKDGYTGSCILISAIKISC